MGNKMNFYLFSNSKKTLFDISDRCNNQTPSICKIFNNIFFEALLNKKKNVAKDIPSKQQL
jgi:hypothetical protein